MNYLWKGAMAFFGALVAVSVIQAVLPFDDSDAPPFRSGFAIRKDAKTGCEYLVTFFGGVTPRLDVKGRPFCWPPSMEQRP